MTWRAHLRRELSLLRAIWLLVNRRRDVGPGEEPLAYSGPLVAMLSVLTVVDGIVAVLLHALLPGSVRTLALVLGMLGLVWLLGFVASLVCYPHVVSDERLRLRFGAFHDVAIPLSAVRHATTTSRQPRTQQSAERLDDDLEMVVVGQANVVVELEPTEFRTLSPRLSGGTLSRVLFYCDDPRRAVALLRTGGHQGEGA